MFTTAGMCPIEHEIMHRPIAEILGEGEESGIVNTKNKENN